MHVSTQTLGEGQVVLMEITSPGPFALGQSANQCAKWQPGQS